MKSEKSTAKKVLSAIGNVLIWVFIIFSVIVTVLAFAAQSSRDGIPSIGGRTILTVRTDSMKPTFNSGDIIIGRKVSLKEAQNLQVGDVITYIADLDGDGSVELNSHRIVEVVPATETSVVKYYTRGDNNPSRDNDPIRADDVRCVYEGTRLPGVGKVLDFLQTPTGFFVVIVVPLIIFFIVELVIFIRKFMEVKNADKKNISAADEELIRQRAVEEYIRAQQRKGATENAASGEGQTPAEPAGEKKE